MENRLPRPLPSISELAARLAAIDRQIDDLQAERAVAPPGRSSRIRRELVGRQRFTSRSPARRSNVVNCRAMDGANNGMAHCRAMKPNARRRL